MNPTSADPTAPPPPPPPPRSSFSCDHHPNEQYTGFCPSCLCERLTSLDHSASNTPSSSSLPSSASAAAVTAIKSLFSSASKANSVLPPPPKPVNKASNSNSFLPELRRTKSFSASKNEALGQTFEPQRKSCDVRVRNTLSSLFTLEDENKSTTSHNKASSSASSSHQNLSSSQKIESCIVSKPVLEETENDGDYNDLENVEDGVVVVDYSGGGVDGDEIIPFQISDLENLINVVELEVNGSSEIVEEEVLSVSNLKPMKDHINLDSQDKKSSGGGFWAAASVFSKKWQKWRQKQKQKMKKPNNDKIRAKLPVEKPISRQYRETQSEIADYGFGRRSCDTDPRFSLDAGRISFDDPRCSFDEPRASWDGYLIGRSFLRMAPMLSVMEDAPAVHVLSSDMQIPVEEPSRNFANEEGVPGGSVQTREYYSDSSSKRRKSLDGSSSFRKTAAAVVAEIDELKMVLNAKVSPTTMDYFQGTKVVVGERDLRDSNSNSMRDDCSETFELGSGFKDGSSSVIGNGERKESKKSRRWSWRLWGFIYRRNGGNKDENEEERTIHVNWVERSFSESWQESRREGSIDLRGGFNRNVPRSNSSASWRNAPQVGGSFGSVRHSNVEVNGHGGKKRDDFVLERNRSARYSPKHIDNGLLRFYLRQ
ncbi:protein OCTOPUS-like [Primulina huaijiensis]|uniref:protein OCTOPUS-like n=1 Tax=Primulina huaijiensis TaxID=1492673 RepID=UPI003CC73F82